MTTASGPHPFMHLRRILSIASALAIALTLSTPSAQAAPTAPPAGDKEAAGDPKLAEAKSRYQKARELFDEGSYDAALIEFRRAYELAPSYRIRYNIALVAFLLNDYREALDQFEKYLAEGGTELSAARVKEVKGRIEQLRARVATVRISSNVSGAQILVDDVVVGQTPAVVRVNVGRRRIQLTTSGRAPASRVVELVGGGPATEVRLDFSTNQPTTIVVAQPASRTPVWIAWGVTGAFAVATATLGGITLAADQNRKSLNEQFGLTAAEVESQESKVRSLALVTDIVGAATILSGGVALYLTLTSSSASKKTARLVPAGPGFALVGSY